MNENPRDPGARVGSLSPAKLALLKRRLGGAAVNAAAQIAPRGTSGPEALSFNQSRQWFLERLTPDSAAYNVSTALRLRGQIDPEAMRMAVAAVVQRHEILRTRFFEVDGVPQQVVDDEIVVQLEVLDIEGSDRETAEEVAVRLASDAAATCFDLEASPLLRFILCRLSEVDSALVLVMHHIISDAWSRLNLLSDLGVAYSASVGGTKPAWPDLTIQYADFAAWQRKEFSEDRLADQLAYWKSRLDGAPPRLEMVTDRARPAVQSQRGASIAAALDADAVERMTQLAAVAGATPFIGLAAVYCRLLSLYTGMTDIVVGVPVAGRQGSELENMVGFFSNTLALRIDLGGDPSFGELLARVRDASVTAFTHQDVPFDLVVDEIGPERNMSTTPVFQTMFQFQQFPTPLPRFEGAQTSSFHVQRRTVPFDMLLAVTRDGRGWRCGLDYCTDLFDERTMRRFLQHYTALVERVTAEPVAPLSGIPLADETEIATACAEWGGRATEYPRDACVHRLFEERANACPEAVALVRRDVVLTYGELDRRANHIAHRLREFGVGPDVIVGIFAHRTLDTYIALLAVLKAGGAYLPLDPEEPGSRLGYMVADSDARLVLVQGASDVARLPDGTESLDVGADIAGAAESTDGPRSDVGARNLAYVIYTSGSTGKPKGVEVEHRAVARLVCGTDYADFGPDRVFLQLAPISFDASTFEIWGALLHGARLVAHTETIPTVAELRRVIETNGVTTLWLTATLFNTLVDEAPETLRFVEQVLTGGEALSPVHIGKAQTALPDIRIVNGYGPTECTTFSCTYSIPKDDWGDRRSVPIGRPIPNSTAYVLDEGMTPCPVGVPGELYLGGDGLARGYLNDPELTAARFLEDPFCETGDGRLYRSGDICRYLDDGLIEFLGRRDTQMKLRGFRIETGEIEAALSSIPGIEGAAVTATEHPVAGKRLVGYVVAGAGSTCTAGDLKARLGDLVPRHMVPDAFVFLAALPLTSSGKLDRKSLPTVSIDRVAGEPPVGPEETAIARIWEEILGVDSVSRDDDFFALGGNSLLALRVCSRLEGLRGAAPPLTALFTGPTVRQLAAVLSSIPERVASPRVEIPQDRSPGRDRP